jgi:hypothetical protein
MTAAHAFAANESEINFPHVYKAVIDGKKQLPRAADAGVVQFTTDWELQVLEGIQIL